MVYPARNREAQKVIPRFTPIPVAENASPHIKLLAALISASRMNVSSVSRRSGISLPTMYRWFRGQCLPNIENYDAILTVVGAVMRVYSPDIVGGRIPEVRESSSNQPEEDSDMGAQTPEGRVKDKVRKVLKDANAWWFMPVQTGFGASELDFICAHPKTGKAFFIETKAPGGKLSPRQEVLFGIHIAAGHAVFVIDGEDNVRDAGGYATTPLGLLKKYLDSSE